MANITRVLGRHIWQRQKEKCAGDFAYVWVCKNCRAYRHQESDSGLPLLGCSSDIDLSKLGDSRLADHREIEMRRRGVLEAAEYAQDLRDASGHDRPPTPFELRLAQQLREELG